MVPQLGMSVPSHDLTRVVDAIGTGKDRVGRIDLRIGVTVFHEPMVHPLEISEPSDDLTRVVDAIGQGKLGDYGPSLGCVDIEGGIGVSVFYKPMPLPLRIGERSH